jgi:Uncharacterized protein conserved in bacteria (DUF2325)
MRYLVLNKLVRTHVLELQERAFATSRLRSRRLSAFPGRSSSESARVCTAASSTQAWSLANRRGPQCSIVGTCLSDEDLRAAICRHRLSVDANARSCDVHSYCVHLAQTDCPLSRTLTKLLNRRYAGAINLIGKAHSDAEVLSLWDRLRDSGQVAAGYWAIMSDRDVADFIKVRVFGEVHMLSHLHGRGAHRLATKLAQAHRQCVDLEARLTRSETSLHAALAERDAVRRTFTEHEMNAYKASGAIAMRCSVDRMVTRLEHKLAQRERALVIARTRARRAEAKLSHIEVEGRQRRRDIVTRPDALDKETASPRDRPSPHLAGRRILYIGGRNTVVPHLRSLAESCAAEFQHHDGGVENNVHRIAHMIQRCDAVVCPVDCVSHGACQLAKSLCLRLDKTFLPIPAASRSAFEQALSRLSSVLTHPVAGSP